MVALLTPLSFVTLDTHNSPRSRSLEQIIAIFPSLYKMVLSTIPSAISFLVIVFDAMLQAQPLPVVLSMTTCYLRHLISHTPSISKIFSYYTPIGGIYLYYGGIIKFLNSR